MVSEHTDHNCEYATSIPEDSNEIELSEASTAAMARDGINYNHALFLYPSDTTRAPIISIQFTGSDNYSI